MTTVPQTKGLSAAGLSKALEVPPYGADVFIDFERGKEFVTLVYRHKQAGPRDQQWALVLAILDDLTAAGLVVQRDGVEITLTPEIAGPGAVQTPDTPYRIHVKVPIRPQAVEQADLDAFTAAVRARYGIKKDKKQ